MFLILTMNGLRTRKGEIEMEPRMTNEQAKAFLAAVDALPATLGTGHTFLDGKPCCAVGHLASSLGYQPSMPTSLGGGADEVSVAYGLDWLDLTPIARANDGTPDDKRRTAVIAEADAIVRRFGFDPQELRNEVSL